MHLRNCSSIHNSSASTGNLFAGSAKSHPEDQVPLIYSCSLNIDMIAGNQAGQAQLVIAKSELVTPDFFHVFEDGFQGDKFYNLYRE